MSGSVNKVILVGNLGADPETKSFQNGGRIANLRIATSENWTDKSTGDRKERTEWHSVVLSGDGLVGVAEKYLRKGKKVYIEGSLRTRKWQDQSGADRFSTEIMVSGPGAVLTMLDSAGGAAPGGRGEPKKSYDDDFDSDEVPIDEGKDRLGEAAPRPRRPDGMSPLWRPARVRASCRVGRLQAA